LDILAEQEHHVYVVWLPKYSPELNAIAGLWGYLKSSALNNYFYGDMALLLKQQLMMLSENYSNTLRQRCL